MQLFTPLFFLLLFFSQIAAQVQIAPAWMKIESSAFDLAEGWDVELDTDGNIYWVVSTDSLNLMQDIKCQKFDPDGNPLWDEPLRYGGPFVQLAYVVESDEDGLYIGGRACQSFGLIDCDMLLLRADKTNGELVWDRTMDFDANGYDEVDGIVLQTDGIYCGGWAQELSSVSDTESDIGLWKLDYDGNTSWTNAFGQTNSRDVQNGHFVVDDEHIFSAGLWGGTNTINRNGYAFLGKFSTADGSFIDSTLFGFQSDDFFDLEQALGMATDGEFLYLTGVTTPTEAIDQQIFVAKYDKDLNPIWFMDWGGEGHESARGIAIHNDIIFVAGFSSSPEIVGNEDRDGLLLALDLDGNPLEHYIWGNTNSNSFFNLRVNDERIYLTGTNIVDDFLGDRNAMLIAFDNPMLSTNVTESEKGSAFQVFPNPANGQITVRLDASTSGQPMVRVLNLQGQLVYQNKMAGSAIQIPLDVSGAFLINLDFDTYSISKMIVNESKR